MPFTKFLENSILLEISLEDHYEKYIKPKYPDINKDAYNKIAELDPTTKHGQRGKYVEWLIKMFSGNEYWYKNANKEEYINGFARFLKVSNKPDINSFKTLQEFWKYIDELPPTENEIKKQDKEIFNNPDEIDIIDVNEDWIIAQPFSQEGNIKLARWKTPVSAKWCTADPNDKYHWNSYTQSGDLICFLNRHNPMEKYQIYVKDGVITESKDFNNNESSEPYKIISNSKNFEKNYGKIKKQDPPYLQLDKYNIAYYYLDDDFDEYDNLNRPLEGYEFDDYEGYNDIEYDISLNDYSYIIDEGYDIFKNNIDRMHSDIKEKMVNFVQFFNDTYLDGEGMNRVSTGHSDMGTEAVYDYFYALEDSYDEYKMDEDNPMPQEENFESNYTYEIALSDWKDEIIREFKNDYEKKLLYIEYFRKEFPYDFQWENDSGISNDPDQLELPFEGKILDKYKNYLI